jgi:adenylyl cyclase-associated protein
MESVLKRLEAVATRLESVGGLAPAGGGGGGLAGQSGSGGASGSQSAYEALLSTELTKLTTAAKAVGGAVLAATELLEKAFLAERSVVTTVASCKQPGAPGLQKLLAPLGTILAESACPPWARFCALSAHK